jgi:septum formation protein
MRVILASQSEGRKQLLDSLNLKYEIIPSNIDEKAIRHEDPVHLVKRIAEAKARAINVEDALVIGGDVVVVCDKEIMEKPVDEKDAERMLKKLSGKTFDVVAGFALYNTKTKRMISGADTAKVTFRKLSLQEIRDYITHCPVTKYAGAFEQDGLLRFSERIEGSPSTIKGLPMQKLIPMLQKS